MFGCLERRTLVIACVCPRRGLYDAEFGDLSRDETDSRQIRDKIGPRPGDLAAAHRRLTEQYAGQARQPQGRARSTLPLSRCLSD